MMRAQDRHLSDEELIQAANGELKSTDQPSGAHLETCVHCKTRAAEFERMMAELAAMQRSRLDSESLSNAGPRSLLRARMAEERGREGNFLSRIRISTWLMAGAVGVVILVAALDVAGVLTVRLPRSQNEAYSPSSRDRDVLPNQEYTPGAVRRASLRQMCASQHEDVVKEVTPSQRQKVMDEYGIPMAKSEEYEVDYLITPGLGGDDDIRNLWPEPYHSSNWNARSKDALEERLHEMVCSNQLDLSTAQRAIASNWIAAYQKYVSDPSPKAPGVKEL